MVSVSKMEHNKITLWRPGFFNWFKWFHTYCFIFSVAWWFACEFFIPFVRPRNWSPEERRKNLHEVVKMGPCCPPPNSSPRAGPAVTADEAHRVCTKGCVNSPFLSLFLKQPGIAVIYIVFALALGVISHPEIWNMHEDGCWSLQILLRD